MFAPITLGRSLRVARSESFVFTETAHAPRTVLAPHAHERAAVSYVITGARTYRFASSAIECIPGSVVFVPAGVTHASEFADTPATGLMIESEEPSAWRQWMAADARLVVACEAIRRELAVNDDITPFALEALAFDVHAHARRDDAPAWLERLREIVRDAAPASLRLSTLAAEAGVDRSRLTRAFRRRHGVSIGAYVRRLRMSRAWQLVAASETALTEVAGICGFADQCHLTRAFRRTFGIAPGQLRAARMPRAFKTGGGKTR